MRLESRIWICSVALLAAACGSTQAPQSGAARPPCPDPVPAHEIRAAPDRCDVTAAMNAVAAAVGACAPDEVGLITMTIVFRSTGEVASAHVTNAPYAETAIARCAERAAAAARIAPFTRPTVAISYPFRTGGFDR